MKTSVLSILGILFSVLLMSCSCTDKRPKESLHTRSQDQLAVKETIEQLFQAMYDGDSVSASLIFLDSARLYTIYSRNDSTIIQEGGINQLIHAIGSTHDFKWIEKSWDYKINTNGSFAQAWCSYAFFAGERFSHCGVDAFHLVKQDQVWRIFSLADSRRKSECLFPKGDFSEPTYKH